MRSSGPLVPIFLLFMTASSLNSNGANASSRPSLSAALSSPEVTDSSTQQLRSQQQILDVLEALQKGTISASAALHLLQDVTKLRTSLQSAGGAAAERWARSRAAAIAGRQQLPSPSEDGTKQQQHASTTRGILIVAGGSHQFRNAIILVKLLRHPSISCHLPVELVYYGPREYDAAAAEALKQHAAETGTSLKILDGSSTPPSSREDLDPHRPMGQITGFKAKVHALAWVTSFDQVIMLDSDNTPLADPTYLFESDAFKAHGSIFWPDFWTNQWMKPVIYSLLGLDTPWEVDPQFRACEAGQVVIDRLRHHDVMEYLWLLNMHSNSGVPGAEPGVVGQCLWGDKDTYPLAFHLAGKAADFYSVQQMPLQALSKPGGTNSRRLVHAGMVHRGPEGDGPLLWLHRTAAGKFWPHCAMQGGASCKVWGFTTPVDQQQLLAMVSDPSAMQYDLQQMDLDWQQQHCTSHSSSSSSSSGQEDGSCQAGVAPEADGSDAQCTAGGLQQSEGSRAHEATVMPCELRKAVGRVPIPVVTADHWPPQVELMLKAAQEVFEESGRCEVHEMLSKGA